MNVKGAITRESKSPMAEKIFPEVANIVVNRYLRAKMENGNKP